jgi:hypothetical protein
MAVDRRAWSSSPSGSERVGHGLAAGATRPFTLAPTAACAGSPNHQRHPPPRAEEHLLGLMVAAGLLDAGFPPAATLTRALFEDAAGEGLKPGSARALL